MTLSRSVAGWTFVLLLCALLPLAAAEPVPLAGAHAHNDYEHPRPLLDALSHGFTSVEADIHLVDGQLLVGHDRGAAGQTLEKLYLDPLLERVGGSNGQVYPQGQGFTLLIDIKTAAEPTYQALEQRLPHYRSMLTRFGADQTVPGAVTIILSGNRPQEMVASQAERFVAIDGRLSDLGSGVSVHLIPLISDNWRRLFRWNGEGNLPDAERTRLLELIQKTHAENRRIRFWATPDRPEAWQVFRDAGVDLINTDDLAGLEQFLRSQ